MIVIIRWMIKNIFILCFILHGIEASYQSVQKIRNLDGVCSTIDSYIYCYVSTIIELIEAASESISSNDGKTINILGDINIAGTTVTASRSSKVSSYYGYGNTIDGLGKYQCFSFERISILFDNFVFNNCTSEEGGAIIGDKTVFTITNSLFQNNQASGSASAIGGALVLKSKSEATLENTIFVNNGATEYGGALYVEDSEATLTNCSFLSNYVQGMGGVFYVTTDSSLTLYSFFFQSNIAIDGGNDIAIYDDDSSTLDLVSNCVNENIYDPGISSSPPLSCVYATTEGSPSSSITTITKNCTTIMGGSLYPSQLSGICQSCPILSQPYSCCGALGYGNLTPPCSSTIFDYNINCSSYQLDQCIYPTSLPTMRPTKTPSSSPTPVPTLACLNGTYWLNGVCEDCPIGKSSNTAHGPQDTNCTSCVAGRYNSYAGGTCISCPSGKLSNSDRSYCSDCESGKYSYQDLVCVSCEAGKYAPQALQDECLSCYDGAVTNNVTGSTTCTSCDAGKYANIYECIECQLGRSSVSGQIECTNCSVGFYSNQLGSAACVACSSGSYANMIGSANCSDCQIGSFQGATGQSECSECISGSYSSEIAASTCRYCIANFDSISGSSSCNLAIVDYYIDNFKSYWNAYYTINDDDDDNGVQVANSGNDDTINEDDGEVVISATPCPNNAKCLGGTNMPIPNEGYWVDRSDIKYVNSIHSCFRYTCRGGRNGVVLNNRSCWSAYAYKNAYPTTSLLTNLTSTSTSTSTDPNDLSYDDLISILELINECEELNEFQQSDKKDSLLCLYGSEGPLCGSCHTGYVFSSSSRICIKCYDANITVIVFIFAFIFFCILYYLFKNNQIQIPEQISSLAIFGSLSEIDAGDFRVLWSNYQIAQSVTWSLNLAFPDPFPSLLASLQFVSLDATSITCIYPNTTELTNVLAISALPYFGAACIIIFFTVKDLCMTLYRMKKAMDDFEDEYDFPVREYDTKSRSSREGAASAFLLLGYLLIPPVCLKQLQALDCIELPESGESFLRIDTSIDCHSQVYKIFSIIDIILFLLSFSVPFIWLIILYSHHHGIHPLPNGEDSLAIWLRENDETLDHLKFLFRPYKPKYYYWEVLEMYRRIIFVGVIPLISPITVRRTGAGFMLATGSIILYRETEPFNKQSTNIVADVAQYSIMLTFATALGLEAKIDQGLNPYVIGGLLCFLNLIVIVIALFSGASRHSVEVAEKKKSAERFATKIEVAIGFDANKFATTFDALDRHAIPPSHALVFWYASTMEQAEDAIKSGIPSKHLFYDETGEAKDEGGIVFSFHRPNDLDAYDKYQFPTQTVVLVASIPRFLLSPLPKKYIKQMHAFENVISKTSNSFNESSLNKSKRSRQREHIKSLSSKEVEEDDENLQQQELKTNIRSPIRKPIIKPNRKLLKKIGYEEIEESLLEKEDQKNKEINYQARLFTSKVMIQPYGVLGQRLLISGKVIQPDNHHVLPPYKEPLGCCIVDPAGLHHIQPPGGPAGASGAAGAIYKWLGINKDIRFAQPIIDRIKQTSDAKYHCYQTIEYGQIHVVHVVGPDLRKPPPSSSSLSTLLKKENESAEVSFTRGEVVTHLSRAYFNVFNEFVLSEQNILRLLPISGGIFSGKFLSEMPQLTYESVHKAYTLLTPKIQNILKEKHIHVCIFAESDWESFSNLGFQLPHQNDHQNGHQNDHNNKNNENKHGDSKSISSSLSYPNNYLNIMNSENRGKDEEEEEEGGGGGGKINDSKALKDSSKVNKDRQIKFDKDEIKQIKHKTKQEPIPAVRFLHKSNIHIQESRDLDKQKEEEDEPDLSSLRILSSNALRALRPNMLFHGLINAKPWYRGELRLPPQNVARAYQLTDEEPRNQPPELPVESDTADHHNRRSSFSRRTLIPTSSLTSPRFNLFSHHHVIPCTPSSCYEYAEEMFVIRSTAEQKKLIVLFHYTQSFLAPLILKTGFRMSTQGQGDGGVFFSIRGPASYELGTNLYEENIIIDCYGRSRLEEYKSKHKLDACIVYGAEVSVLSQAPGGRDNATVFAKPTFESLSLIGKDGEYFLRPDRILGCFYLPPDTPPAGYDEATMQFSMEKQADLETKKKLKENLLLHSKNEEEVHSILQRCGNSKEGGASSMGANNEAPLTSTSFDQKSFTERHSFADIKNLRNMMHFTNSLNSRTRSGENNTTTGSGDGGGAGDGVNSSSGTAGLSPNRHRNLHHSSSLPSHLNTSFSGLKNRSFHMMEGVNEMVHHLHHHDTPPTTTTTTTTTEKSSNIDMTDKHGSGHDDGDHEDGRVSPESSPPIRSFASSKPMSSLSRLFANHHHPPPAASTSRYIEDEIELGEKIHHHDKKEEEKINGEDKKTPRDYTPSGFSETLI